MSGVQLGRVKFFSHEKGYGYIKPETGRDVFFHRNDVHGSSDAMQPDTLVSYVLIESANKSKGDGMKASRVTVQTA